MKYTLIYLTLVSSILFAAKPVATKQVDKKELVEKKELWQDLDAETRKVLDLIANDKLSEALTSINNFEKNYSQIPFYDCLRSAVFYKITEEYKDKEFDSEFNDYVAKAVTALEDESKDSANGPKYKAKRMQFLGSAYGYRGMYRTLAGLWASAFFDGKRGSDTLEESLKLDPTLVDNKAGIGTYWYWRSAKSGVVKYLLFWGDKKREGIAALKEGVEKGHIVKQWSLGGLLRIYIEEKKWDIALDYANQILKDSPDDSGTLRKKAMVLYMMDKKEEAFNLLRDVLLPHFKAMDNIPLFDKRTLNTANVQIETIYRMLKINNELAGKLVDSETKKKYLEDIETLSKRISPSFSDIRDYVSKAKEF